MKHLKTFEELDKETYFSAADKLDKHQHHNRARKVRKHGHEFADNQPYFNLGDGTQYIDNEPRLKREMRFVKCLVSKPLMSRNIVVEFHFDDNGTTRYLSLSKRKKDDGVFTLRGFGSAFEQKSMKSVAFYDRAEALKFIDFINQSDLCKDLDEDGLLNNITVNSVYLPIK